LFSYGCFTMLRALHGKPLPNLNNISYYLHLKKCDNNTIKQLLGA